MKQDCRETCSVSFTLKLLILFQRHKHKILEINNFSSQNILTLPREPGDDSRPASVGKPLPGIEMLVSKGLIRTRSSMYTTLKSDTLFTKRPRRINDLETRPN